MKIQKFLILFIAIPLFAFTTAHKFYVSVTNIEHNQNEKALQITTRIFIDDFQSALEERYDLKEELTVEKATQEVEQMMAKYLKKKLKIWVNGEQKTFKFLGKEYEDDVTICYLEISGINKVNTLEVENAILYEMEEDQQNLVHVKINNERKSLLLVKENDKGLLKF
ncbi:DUF6702 family protein [Kordia algicida OT-1]|uniref:Peptidase E n=1 Tax=Kordia algicida OT-1 TaxID=391587 RepID=A9E100_9FLAO|nr:DUF6702 family protein [Kordia algicida]EDP95563.1 hypothetical protein KAOT1_21966 [Kordia algicida OT-1]